MDKPSESEQRKKERGKFRTKNQSKEIETNQHLSEERISQIAARKKKDRRCKEKERERERERERESELGEPEKHEKQGASGQVWGSHDRFNHEGDIGKTKRQ